MMYINSINPDFRTQLEEIRRHGDWRLFRWIPAGAYRLSIQASGAHSCVPREILRAVEDYDCWDVELFTADARWVTPRTHPEVFADPLWSRYWVYWIPLDMRMPATGLYVPTDVVQTFYDFLVLGPETYREVMITDAS